MEVNRSDIDPLDSLLSLEEQYYSEGHALGLVDGSKAGRAEGRAFGLEKGFEKFAEMGRMNGRAALWQGRMRNIDHAQSPGQTNENSQQLPDLSGSERLRRHLTKLTEMTDAETLAMENSEDAVSEADERIRDAKAKATLIARIVGEETHITAVNDDKDENSAKLDKRVRSSEMEDFGRAGSRNQNAPS